MKVTLYVVGNNIKIANFLGPSPEFSIDFKFDKQILIDSIIKSNSPLFFLKECDALNYAMKTATKLRKDGLTICPVVGEIVMKLVIDKDNGKKASGTKLLSSTIIKMLVGKRIKNHVYQQQSQQLNYELTLTQVNKKSSFFSFLNKRTLNNSLLCTQDNYHGNFDALFIPLTNFTFLCANNRGITPLKQNTTYHLPNEIAKKICEYVAGHTLGS